MAEKEYIERGAVCKVISKEVNVQRLSYLPRKLELEGLKTVMNQVNKIPAADVVEVRHGEWIAKDCIVRSPFARNYYCSVCKYEPLEAKNYCPDCGAKMDGERKDNP